MDLAIVVYLIGLVNNLSFASGLSSLASIFSLIASLIFWGVAHVNASYNYDNLPNASEAKTIEISKKGIKISSIVLLVTSLISIVIPSKTDMYIMTGLVVGEKVLTSDKGNELLDKSYLLLVSKIEKSIEDTNKVSDE